MYFGGPGVVSSLTGAAGDAIASRGNYGLELGAAPVERGEGDSRFAPPPMTEPVYQRCIDPACGKTYGVEEVRTACGACGNLLDVAYDWARLPIPKKLAEFEAKWSTRYVPLD